MSVLDGKYKQLQTILNELDSVVIGYSGGVDSTFLAKAATEVLGEKALAVVSVSDSFPAHERQEAQEFAKTLGLNYLEIHTNELNNPDFRRNDKDRCYYCKEELVTHLLSIADEKGFKAVALGTVVDDLGDYRPGQQAAKKLGAVFPLVEANLTKEDVRELSKRLNVPTWDKPSFACLSSRFPYGEEITKNKLHMVENAESILRELGFKQLRVRHHGNIARIEVLPPDMIKIVMLRDDLIRLFKDVGYTYVTMDLLGYRTGSLNEMLYQIEKTGCACKTNCPG